MGPFVFGRRELGKAFVNRVKEQKQLLGNLTNGIHTILISPRRWGKSVLVSKVAEQLQSKKGFAVAKADLFTIRTEQDFYEALSNAVIKATSSSLEEAVRNGVDWLKQFAPKLTYAPDAMQEISIGLDFTASKVDPGAILDMPETIAAKKGIHLIIMLDEFQNLAHLKDSAGFQKLLRAHWQGHSHVTYCLYGSRRNLLLEFFASQSMPFYKFGQIMALEKIAPEEWVPFITSRFAETGKAKPSPELLIKLVEKVDANPFYVQQLAYLFWTESDEAAGEVEFDRAFRSLIDQNRPQLYRLLEDLTEPQLNTLRAISAGAEKLSSQAMLTKYKLRSAALVKKSLQALEKKELLDLTPNGPELLEPLVKYLL